MRNKAVRRHQKPGLESAASRRVLVSVVRSASVNLIERPKLEVWERQPRSDYRRGAADTEVETPDWKEIGCGREREVDVDAAPCAWHWCVVESPLSVGDHAYLQVN